ncbi:hypothetical protein FACS1894216_01450 [Synergistales bacterium]|nr:hypothetical protein FACS1894216_01450 [Synergistales bacterium]
MNWRSVSVRKPLAVYTALLILGFAVIGFATQRDIPANIAGLLSVVASVIIGSYFGSSAFEACKAPKEDEPEDDK